MEEKAKKFLNQSRVAYSYLDELRASNSKTLWELEEGGHIRNIQLLIGELYTSHIISETNVLTNLMDFYNKCKNEIDALKLVQIKGNIDEISASDPWAEWQEHFLLSAWSAIYLLTDEELHIGTLILYKEEITDPDNLVEELVRDMSWSLLKVHEYLIKHSTDLHLHSLTYLVVGKYEYKGDVDLAQIKCKIIGEVERRSGLLHESKITFLLDKHFNLHDHDWEVHYLANHLIPLRKKQFDLFILREEIALNIKESKAKLIALGEEIRASNVKSKVVESILKKIKNLNQNKYSIHSATLLSEIKSLFIGMKMFTERPFIMPLKGKMNVIFAPNGYGKSTIIDGIRNTMTKHTSEQDFNPLWNVRDDSTGIFAINQRNNDRKIVLNEIIQDYSQQIKNTTYLGQREMETAQPTDKIDSIYFKLFCYTSEYNHNQDDQILNLLIRMLADCDLLDLAEERSIQLGEESEFTDRFNEIVKKMKIEISTVINMRLLPLLTAFTTVMTADSWLYKFRYKYILERGLTVERDDQSGNYRLGQVLNLGEQKIVNLAIFFLLYYLEGFNVSKVILLDDIFDTFDQRQCYNILRFISTFSHLSQMQTVQWIILSHWKAVLDYFYYGNLRYFGSGDNEIVGYYNFISQQKVAIGDIKEESAWVMEKYNEYLVKLDAVDSLYLISAGEDLV